MSSFNVHAGHNYKVQGASGCFNETSEARNVKNKVISLLRAQGHTVYDCTDEDGATVNQNLVNIVNKCNQHSVTLDISIHFNAFDGSANGVEVLQYDSGTNAYSSRIVSKIAELGFYNRKVKDGSWLYVCSNTISPAILIECCFCDSSKDAGIYNADKMAKAIVEGILNKSISTSSSSNSSSNTSSSSSSNLYRIRKSWGDAKSQIGAFASLDNAKKACIAGYTVYDWNGNAVYSIPVATQTTNSQLYRVRKTWSDSKSQLGAYKSLDNAKNACPSGYSVFDWNGKVVYTPKSNSTTTTTNTTPNTSTSDTKQEVADKPTVVAPPAENISILNGVDHNTFITIVGNKAKENMKNTGVLASITIAQAILESAWGQSELSLKANNLFGMKSSLSGNTWGSEWDGKIYAKRSNEENADGTVVSVLSDFRAYDSIDKSIKDHSDYLCNAKNGSSLRYNGIKNETDYKKVAQIIKDGGYATDSGYVAKLCDIIETNNLDVFDKDANPEDNSLNYTLEKTNNLLEVLIDLIKKIFKLA